MGHLTAQADVKHALGSQFSTFASGHARKRNIFPSFNALWTQAWKLNVVDKFASTVKEESSLFLYQNEMAFDCELTSV